MPINFKIAWLTLMFLSLLAPYNARAQKPDSEADPESPDSAMFTIQDVYNVLDTRTPASKRSTPFTEATGQPGTDSMPTLDDIMTLATNRAPVAKTGQQVSYTTNDDGAFKLGTAWPEPRFTDNNDDTITDNLTSLMWTKNANLPGGTLNWTNALEYITVHLNTPGGAHYAYGGYTDWRLPNIRELFSLIDYGNNTPALPAGHPFDGVQNDNYWSSTSLKPLDLGWILSLQYGNANHAGRVNTYRIWPVRGGGH